MLKMRLRRLAQVGLLLGFGTALTQCTKLDEPFVMPEMMEYSNSAELFSLKIPSGWFQQEDGSGISVYNSQEAMNKFMDPAGPGKAGVRFSYSTKEMDVDSTTTTQTFVDKFKNDAMQLGWTLNPEEAAQLGGKDGVKVTYVIPLSAKSKVYGVQYFTLQDSLLHNLIYEGFNELFEKNKPILDAMLPTVALAKPKLTAEAVAHFAPSETFKTVSGGAYFDISYPDNFEHSQPKKTGDTEYVMEIKGVRFDCLMRIDISPAKKNPLEKVIEQSKAGVKQLYAVGNNTVNATVGGEKGGYFTLSRKVQDQTISGRSYFVVKNDKVYNVMMLWNKTEEAVYLPTFEKILGTIKLK